MTVEPSDVLDLVRGWPAREVVCFRGLAASAPAAVDEEVVLDGPCPATTDAQLATENFTTPGALVIAASGARRVVHRGRVHDGEVVLMPGTRFRVLGQARLDELRLTLVADVDSRLDASELGRRAAAAIRRDRAHEPHPDLLPDRYTGELRAAPAGTWDPGALTSAESPDFTSMSAEQVQAWFASRERSSATRFRDAPPHVPDPVKQADHPHLRRVGWEVRLRPGAPCSLRLGARPHPGMVEGLRELAGPPHPVLVVEAEGRWACARLDGQPWAASLDALTGSAPQRDVPVTAWPLTGDAPTMGRGREGTLRTVV